VEGYFVDTEVSGASAIAEGGVNFQVPVWKKT
jgi:hypothetical protein